MRKIPSFSIKSKMISILAGVLLMAIISAAYFMRRLVYQNIVDQKMTTVNILTASIVHDIKYEYDSRIENREGILSIIDKYITYYRIIESISFYNSDYINIADSNPKDIGRATQDEDIINALSLAKPALRITRSDSSNLGIRSIFPILRGSKITSAIDMKISIKDIEATLSAINHRIAAILIISIISACTGLYIFLRSTILQRLSRLMKMTRQIAAGNYDIRICDTCRDELSELARAFDQMTFDLKKSKQEIEDYNQHLETRVKEATADLNKAYEDLKNTQSQLVLNEKMASLGILISGIAHEINTPVGAIHNVARNLGEKIIALPEVLNSFKKDTEVVTANLVDCLQNVIRYASGDQQDTSLKETRRIENLLKSQGIAHYKQIVVVLAQLNFMEHEKVMECLSLLRNQSIFSLLESIGSISQAIKIVETSSMKIGQIVRALKYYAYTDKDRIEMIQINESIKTALILLTNRLKHTINLTTKFDPDIPKISCTSEIHQIWTNLLNNAIDAIESIGEGYVGKIQILTKKEDDQVVIILTDNGIGIPEDKIDKIFDPFFTTKDIGKGTGLGLSIVSGIIKKHNGKINVESERGHTTFEVRFPIKQRLFEESERYHEEALVTAGSA